MTCNEDFLSLRRAEVHNSVSGEKLTCDTQVISKEHASCGSDEASNDHLSGDAALIVSSTSGSVTCSSPPVSVDSASACSGLQETDRQRQA